MEAPPTYFWTNRNILYENLYLSFAFLFLLFYAFWQKSFWIGLLVLNIGNLLKIGVSIFFGGDAGMASIVPTLSSILILNILAIAIWKMNKLKSNI